MALLLETNLGGDLVIDLDIEGSPALCKNILKLAKIRYYTGSLLYNVHANRFCQGGDPTGTGKGGACIFGVLDDDCGNDETTSTKRFLKSTSGRRLSPAESRERGRVVTMELPQTKDTIGSQFLITLGQGRAEDGMDGYLLAGEQQESTTPLSLGMVTEDEDNILEKIDRSYCDPDGRPYADIRIVRMLVLHDPFPDPPGLLKYLREKIPDMVVEEGDRIMASPERSKPPQESVLERIPANELDDDNEETEAQTRERQEKEALQEDHQRAVVLELLGDLPSAEIKAPEHVLFVCKLNAVTQDEDLELIFSRFDQNCKVEIIRDQETGSSLQYAFIEFSNKQQCVEAYFKMNNALVDDRRIKVDFSQSVAKLWNKHTQKMRMPRNPEQDSKGPPPSRRSNNNNGGLRQNHQSHTGLYDNSRDQRGQRHERSGGSNDFGRSRQPDDDFSRGRRDAPSLDNRRPQQRYNDRVSSDERHNHIFREGDGHRRDNSRDSNRHRDERNDLRIRRERHEHRHGDHRRSRHDHEAHQRRRVDRPVEDGNGERRSRSRDNRRGREHDEGRGRHHSSGDDMRSRRHPQNNRRRQANEDEENRGRGHKDERLQEGEENHRERRRYDSEDDRSRRDNKRELSRSTVRDGDESEERKRRKQERSRRESGDNADKRLHKHERRRHNKDKDDERDQRKRERETDDEVEERRHRHEKRDKVDQDRHRKKKGRKKVEGDDDSRKRRKREKRHRQNGDDQKDQHRARDGDTTNRTRQVEREEEGRKQRH